MKRASVLWVGVACWLVCGGAFGQYALDRSLYSGGGINPVTRSSTLAMSRPIYTLDRNTGTFEYNRTNAFNDNAYALYERQRFGLFDAPGPVTVNKYGARAGGVPTGALAQPMSPAGAPRTYGYSGSGAVVGGGMSRSPYSASPSAAARPASLAAPVYRPR